MNTKKAIEFLENGIRNYEEMLEAFGSPEMLEEKVDIRNIIIKHKAIIALLQRGEKYEAMWGKLKKRGNELGLFMANVPINLEGNLDEFMEEFEKKYFLKQKEEMIK